MAAESSAFAALVKARSGHQRVMWAFPGLRAKFIIVGKYLDMRNVHRRF
jgi:hypothetical protein